MCRTKPCCSPKRGMQKRGKNNLESHSPNTPAVYLSGRNRVLLSFAWLVFRRLRGEGFLQAPAYASHAHQPYGSTKVHVLSRVVASTPGLSIWYLLFSSGLWSKLYDGVSLREQVTARGAGHTLISL